MQNLKEKNVNDKEFIKFKRNISMRLVFRIFIYSILAFVILELLVDGIYNDNLANSVASVSRPLYEFLVSNKIEIMVAICIVIFAICSYLVLKSTLNYMEEMIYAIDNILKEPNAEISLNSDLITVENKLNRIRVDLIKRQNEAKEAEQKKNDLIAYMAHDLKTPLTSIIGYLTLLSDEKEVPKHLQDRYIKIALDKALRVEDLTNQFFDITRYNLQDMPINKQMIDISYLLDQLEQECYPMLEGKNLKLHINKPNKIIYLGDGDKLARAFDNLIKNAINYSYNGTTIEIDVRSEWKNNTDDNEDQDSIKSISDSITDKESSGDIIIEFRNKGNKIPSYKLDKIFERFYRADESRESSSGGAGLGLAITKQIIELHGGSISVKNDDEYIVFTIVLKR